MPTGLVRTPEETYMHKFLAHMGFEVDTKVVPWTMGKVSRDNPDRIEYFTMDVGKGVENFFDFFAFGSGLEMEEPTRQAMMKAFRLMEDTSEEECRKLVNLTFADWTEKFIEDPIAKTVLELAAPLMGAPANVVNYGAFANVMGTFPRVGALLFWYPKHGTMEDMVISPLARYYRENGGTVLANRGARSIEIQNGRATGVVAQNNETRLIEEYEGQAVICAVPIFEAIGRNLLATEHLTKDWAQAIELCSRLSYDDLSVFYILSHDVFPRDGHGWVHIFDSDYGLPTYVGDWCVGSQYNVTEPPGKQFIYSYIPGGLPPRVDRTQGHEPTAQLGAVLLGGGTHGDRYRLPKRTRPFLRGGHDPLGDQHGLGQDLSDGFPPPRAGAGTPALLTMSAVAADGRRDRLPVEAIYWPGCRTAHL